MVAFHQNKWYLIGNLSLRKTVSCSLYFFLEENVLSSVLTVSLGIHVELVEAFNTHSVVQRAEGREEAWWRGKLCYSVSGGEL